MRKKLLLLSICFVSMLINCSLAQELATYDTEYFQIALPRNTEVYTRLEFDQGLYDNDPQKKSVAYNENTESFSSSEDLQVACVDLRGIYLIKIYVYDVDEKLVTTGRENFLILSEYNKIFDTMEEKDDQLKISRAKTLRTDGANFVYTDMIYPLYGIDNYERSYYFTFPWKGDVKMFSLSISSFEEMLDHDYFVMAESCLSSLSLKH